MTCNRQLKLKHRGGNGMMALLVDHASRIVTPLDEWPAYNRKEILPCVPDGTHSRIHHKDDRYIHKDDR